MNIYLVSAVVKLRAARKISEHFASVHFEAIGLVAPKPLSLPPTLNPKPGRAPITT